LIKCIIVEDERLAQTVIQSHLKRIVQFELVGICNNALEAKEILNNQQVDLIFLDIQLPGMNGLSFLKTLQDPPAVILTTAYAEYALESYEFNVIDYLLKPISFERFSKAVNKIIEGKILTQPAKFESDHIYIKSGSKFFKVDFAEIVYIEGMKDYLKICTTDAMLVTHQTMSEMEKFLPAKQFIRVHKSYIVSLAAVNSIVGNFVQINGKEIPIGANYKDQLIGLVFKLNN